MNQITTAYKIIDPPKRIVLPQDLLDSFWSFIDDMGLKVGNIVSLRLSQRYFADYLITRGPMGYSNERGEPQCLNTSYHFNGTNKYALNIQFEIINLLKTGIPPMKYTFYFIYDSKKNRWQSCNFYNLRKINGKELPPAFFGDAVHTSNNPFKKL